MIFPPSELELRLSRQGGKACDVSFRDHAALVILQSILMSKTTSLGYVASQDVDNAINSANLLVAKLRPKDDRS